MSKLEKFLKESALSQEAKDLILEAWNEEKQDLAAQIRDEMKTRVESDKAMVIEGLSKMANEVIMEEMQTVYDEKRKLMEDRAVVRSHLNKFADFSNGVLAGEISELRKDRQALGESLSKFAQFSNGVIAEELKEFHKEKQELVEAKVKLMAEGRRKLHEAQSAWIKKASAEAADFIEAQTRNEFTQLRTQLDEANKNMFGRKIFEAFATEFMNSQYSESKELNKLSEALKAKATELQDSKVQLAEAREALLAENRKVRIMEDKQKRGKILSDLMRPLTQEQRSVMESLLEKTPTEKLNEDFNKYLKPVLNESGPARKPTAATKAPLNESRSEVTGNRKNTLLESNDFDAFDAELEKIVNLAKK